MMELNIVEQVDIKSEGDCSSSGDNGSNDQLFHLVEKIREKVHHHPCYPEETHHHYARMHIVGAPE